MIVKTSDLYDDELIAPSDLVILSDIEFDMRKLLEIKQICSERHNSNMIMNIMQGGTLEEEYHKFVKYETLKNN